MNDPVRHLNGTVPVKLTGKLESRWLQFATVLSSFVIIVIHAIFVNDRLKWVLDCLTECIKYVVFFLRISFCRHFLLPIESFINDYRRITI